MIQSIVLVASVLLAILFVSLFGLFGLVVWLIVNCAVIAVFRALNRAIGDEGSIR